MEVFSISAVFVVLQPDDQTKNKRCTNRDAQCAFQGNLLEDPCSQ